MSVESPVGSTNQTVIAPVAPSHGLLRPLGQSEVTITAGFWEARQQINDTAILDHLLHWQEREGWIGNFDLAAAGRLPDGRRGREFSDSEVYKNLEALAWEIGRLRGRRDQDPATRDRAGELEERFTAVVARVAAAQEPDGYLNTMFGRPGQPARWSDLEWGHELYCAGHLLQAAVARARTRPDAEDGLVEVAVSVADHVCSVFGPDGIAGICGHPEIEVALVEFARVTGEDRYLRQAQLFVQRRGHGILGDIEFGRTYFQDDMPVAEATVLRGHAVRASYLSAGAVDLAVETGDDALLDALATQWATTTARRTYITGGQGSHHQDEGFGADWELPPDRAYSETCAGVASIMFSWRLLLARGDARCADLIERTLYNVVATSPASDGRSFFYTNTLHQRTPGTAVDPDTVSPRASSALRAPWFAVTCCPPNIARTLASLDCYLATIDEDGLQLHQYAPAEIRTRLPGGEVIDLEIATEYPRTGHIAVLIRTDATGPWSLSMRVPAWADGASWSVVSADRAEPEQPAAPGVLTVTRRWRAGDRVLLTLPMQPRLTVPAAGIDAVRGCVAVERGPEVLCLESVDLDGADVATVAIDPTVAPRTVDGAVVVRCATVADPAGGWPYGSAPARPAAGAVDVALVPYHDWARRGPSTMRVWIPRAPGGRGDAASTDGQRST